MAANGDTLSWVLLVVAVCAWGSAALGALALGGLTLARRWGVAASARGDGPTVQFRMPVAQRADTSDCELADPTDRLASLFEAPTPANDDPFEGDTVPFVDVESLGRAEAVVDL